MSLSLIIQKYKAPFLKYTSVGFVCALINWFIFYILNYKMLIYYILSALIAFIVSTTVNYFLSRLIFASRERGKVTEYFFVVIASGIAMGIDLFVMYLLVERIKLVPMVAKICGTGTAFLFNYVSRQFFIFSYK